MPGDEHVEDVAAHATLLPLDDDSSEPTLHVAARAAPGAIGHSYKLAGSPVRPHDEILAC